ncbi:MAG: tetratricopeptide repeat protein [Leptospirales bacterium]|nr:tetratricopeptide repeat protein [Leptospirales bacterium]
MKKISFALLVMSVFTFFGCGDFSLPEAVKDFFIPGAVKKVRLPDIERMQREADESAKRYRKQLESAERVRINYEQLGRRYADQGSWTPAIECFTTAIGYGSAGADIHYMLGASYANRARETNNKEDMNMAESHYSKAISKNPELVSAQYGLGLLVFFLKKDHARGIEIMRELSFRRPDFFEARFALGRFYYENGEIARALSTYESLYSALQDRKDSSITREMRDNCKANITRIMSELQIQRSK